MKTSTAVLLIATSLVGGCTVRYKPADMGGLYSQAAQHEGPERHAIIVIPGILGSRLEDSTTGKVAWGAFRGGYAKPNEAQGANLVALPMEQGRELSELRDNVENARRLHEFILEKEAYIREETKRRYGSDASEVKFDIVAHSMGSLLARYYLRYGAADLPEDGSLPELTWAGNEFVDRAILVAPPNAGSLEALLNLVEGRKFGPTLPRYSPAILGTFPSLYQLLPRSRHGAVVWAEGGQPVKDLLDPELWSEMGWGLAAAAETERLDWLLPGTPSSADRRATALDHQRKALRRARQFAAALDRPGETPAGLDLMLVAGDAVDTPAVIAVDRTTGHLRIMETGPGDGSVLRSSALMDERVGATWQPTLQSPIGWTDTLMLFTNHLGLTRDRIFTDNVLFWLLEDPRNS